MTSRRMEDINKGLSNYDSFNNEVVGTKFYIIVIDVTGQFHFITNIIKAYRPGSLIIVNDWEGEAANLNLPCRYFPRAEYHLNPSRTLEKMTSEVRMFGRDKEYLLKEWKKAWEKRANIASSLASKYHYFMEHIDDFTDDEE